MDILVRMSMPSSHFGLRQLCGIKRTPSCSIIVRKDNLALWASWILSIYLKTKPMCFYTAESTTRSGSNCPAKNLAKIHGFWLDLDSKTTSNRHASQAMGLRSLSSICGGHTTQQIHKKYVILCNSICTQINRYGTYIHTKILD